MTKADGIAYLNNMENMIAGSPGKLLWSMTLLLAVWLGGGLRQLRADDWGGHQSYHNQSGLYDGKHRYHHYDQYRHHRGYWDQRNGASFFINVG